MRKILVELNHPILRGFPHIKVIRIHVHKWHSQGRSITKVGLSLYTLQLAQMFWRRKLTDILDFQGIHHDSLLGNDETQ
jgi:hypothetical protein